MEGVTLTVTDPDGKEIDEAKRSDSKVVNTAENKLAGFVIREPKPGRWTLKVDAPAGSPDFQVLFWTVPDAEEPLATIDRTLDGLLGSDFITAAAGSLPGFAAARLALSSNDCPFEVPAPGAGWLTRGRREVITSSQ